MASIGRRLSVIGPSLLLGAFCAGLYAVNGLPSGMNWHARFELWTYMLMGPILDAIWGDGPVPGLVGDMVCLGWFSLPALAAHPIRPNRLTGTVTVIGAFFWFASGILTMLMCVWGA